MLNIYGMLLNVDTFVLQEGYQWSKDKLWHWRNLHTEATSMQIHELWKMQLILDEFKQKFFLKLVSFVMESLASQITLKQLVVAS